MNDVEGRGWLDLQVNGYRGVDYNGDHLTTTDVRSVADQLAARGVAHHLPTLITGPTGRTLRNARVIASARQDGLAARVPGLHLEGPFVSPEDGARGAHPREHCRTPDLAWVEDVQAAADGAVKVVTLAPELDGALELTCVLAGRGILVALGHSDAPPDLVREAVAAGARLVTHFGNGIKATLPRHPNLLWEVLAADVALSLILDGHHLPASVAEVAYRSKGAGRLCLISDSVELAGRPPGRHLTPVGDEVDLLPGGRLQLAGTPYLAGSTISLLDAVRLAWRDLRWPLAEVLRMVADTPAQLIDCQAHSRTTLRVSDGILDVVAVDVEGERVFDSEDTL